jgi:hypothetical protein
VNDPTTSTGVTGAPALLIIIGIIVVSALLYFLPTIIGSVRRAPSLLGIVLVNIFFGWSIIGWIVALVLALRTRQPGYRRRTVDEIQRWPGLSPGYRQGSDVERQLRREQRSTDAAPGGYQTQFDPNLIQHLNQQPPTDQPPPEK